LVSSEALLEELLIRTIFLWQLMRLMHRKRNRIKKMNRLTTLKGSMEK